MMYALKVTCKEALSTVQGRPPMTKKGTVVWLYVDTYGWSSRPSLAADSLVFESRASAEKAAEMWRTKWHPWFFAPDKIEVVEVKPIYKRTIEGYKEA